MNSLNKKIAKSHDDVLEEIADALDISDSKFEEAKKRYESIGQWLERDGSELAKFSPEISPQGSFLLGTVTRPLKNEEEYAVDLICTLKASKSDFTQKSLKDAVGREVTSYANSNNMTKLPDEARRCWTLNYADGAQFHMDILPALPDAQRYQTMLVEQGYKDLAKSADLSGLAIAITDSTHPLYDQPTEDWPQSNPLGYAEWFRSRMQIQLNEQQTALAKRVDSFPGRRAKTPLQRTIQLLKRHRDFMFADDGEHKPISIIITTLSAHAYNNESTISEALRRILTKMEDYIESRGTDSWIENPVNPNENVADKWAENPIKRENFFRWLEQARQDFGLYLRANSFNQMPAPLIKHLGTDLVGTILEATHPTTSDLATPAIASLADNGSKQRVQSTIEEINREGPQSRPWAEC